MSTGKSTKSQTIAPNQCKAARDLLGWKQSDLSAKSSIGESTIADFERGAREPAVRTLRDIRVAFEDVGIKFISDEAWLGVKLLTNSTTSKN
jgi:transcriptional regulator with XRE-family HTH domain